MPELPEVETIRNDLRRKILGKKIIRVDIKLPKAVKNTAGDFTRILTGNKFIEIDRIGKLMIFILAEQKKYLLVHLKMTGQLIYCARNYIVAGGHSLPELAGEMPNKYTRVIIYFSDRSALFFNDMRTFGYLHIVDENGLAKAKTRFGLNPLSGELNYSSLEPIFLHKKANVKALLLNQKLIAGIGNIYADEILFEARIRPDRRGSSLTVPEIKKIILATKKILKKAIQYRGTTFNDYVDADGKQGNYIKMLKVYGRKGEICRFCDGRIEKKKIAGRGTHFCPRCQK